MNTSFYSEKELQEIGFASVGENVLISRKTSIYAPDKMNIGNNVRIDDYAVLSGKLTLGNHVHIAVYVALFGGSNGIVIEDYAGISSNCVVYSETDDYSGEHMTNPTIPQPYRSVNGGQVILKKHVLIGTGSSILPGVTIGEGTAVGSMSLVNKSLDPWGIYVGSPCRKIKERSRKLLEIEKEMVKDTKKNSQIC